MQAAHIVLHHLGQRRRAPVVEKAERHAGKVVGKPVAQQGFQTEGGEMRDAEGVAAQGKGSEGERDQQRGGKPVGAPGKQVFENVRHQQQRGGTEGNGSGGNHHRAADLQAYRVDDAPGRGVGHGGGSCQRVGKMIADFIRGGGEVLLHTPSPLPCM